MVGCSLLSNTEKQISGKLRAYFMNLYVKVGDGMMLFW